MVGISRKRLTGIERRRIGIEHVIGRTLHLVVGIDIAADEDFKLIEIMQIRF